jgi:hypothetical protein
MAVNPQGSGQKTVTNVINEVTADIYHGFLLFCILEVIKTEGKGNGDELDPDFVHMVCGPLWGIGGHHWTAGVK